jgi:hypothetical protein
MLFANYSPLQRFQGHSKGRQAFLLQGWHYLDFMLWAALIIPWASLLAADYRNEFNNSPEELK